RLDDFVLKVGGETRDVDRDIVDLRILAQPACRQLVQTAPLSDELADQVHEGVEAPQIDADVTAASRSPSSPPSPSSSGRTFGRADLALVRSTSGRHSLGLSH